MKAFMTLAILAIGVGLPAAAAFAGPSPMPPNAKVYIIWPQDGQVIPGGKFWVRMGLSGAGVAPAGVEKQFTGHHHILVDADLPSMDEAIPNEERHLHFGRGQTETSVDLPPGTHTLQLLMGDANHVPHDPPVTFKRITIRVLAEKGSEAASAN